MAMTLEMICRANDISMWTAANAMANLIEKGLVEPSSGTPTEAVAELRLIAEAHRPRIPAVTIDFLA